VSPLSCRAAARLRLSRAASGGTAQADVTRHGTPVRTARSRASPAGSTGIGPYLLFCGWGVPYPRSRRRSRVSMRTPTRLEQTGLGKIEPATAVGPPGEPRIGTGTGIAYIGCNGLVGNADGSVRWFEPNLKRVPASPIDPTLAVLRLDRADSPTMAILTTTPAAPFRSSPPAEAVVKPYEMPGRLSELPTSRSTRFMSHARPAYNSRSFFVSRPSRVMVMARAASIAAPPGWPTPKRRNELTKRPEAGGVLKDRSCWCAHLAGSRCCARRQHSRVPGRILPPSVRGSAVRTSP
jgi:hypothetical protein